MSEPDSAVASAPGPAHSGVPWVKSLRKLAVRGSLYEAAGLGVDVVLRLLGSIIVSRLLFPEAYGLMALVMLINYGLVMVSDVGLQQAVIQNERGDEPDFYSTAWTIQIVRGAALCALAMALAYPASLIYEEPQLFPLVLVGSLQLLIAAFASTSEFTLRRHVQVGPIVTMTIVARVVSFSVVLTWAWLFPSVWALLGGALVNICIRTVWTHCLRPWSGYRVRWTFHRESARAIIRFGKWVFGSSLVFFGARQGDRILLGKVLGMGGLGVYQIGYLLAEAPGQLVNRLTHGVFFAVYSRAWDGGKGGTERLRAVFYKSRLGIDLLLQPVIGLAIALGAWAVDLMFDDRYLEAGWILQVLLIRTAMQAAVFPGQCCLFARGDIHYSFSINVAKAAWVLAGIPLGWAFYGIAGVVWAVGLSELPTLVIVWQAMVRKGLFVGLRETLAPGALVLGYGLGSLLVLALPSV